MDWKKSGSLTLISESSVESFFAAAYFLNYPERDRAAMNKTLIVESPEEWNNLIIKRINSFFGFRGIVPKNSGSSNNEIWPLWRLYMSDLQLKYKVLRWIATFSALIILQAGRNCLYFSTFSLGSRHCLNSARSEKHNKQQLCAN